ncbi:MAG TPA: hypothetical protein VMJ13_10345 [Candidatus Acidoferrum sp.]|nr:hypothetical protein [Candidatus Acidoferrum sp.]
MTNLARKTTAVQLTPLFEVAGSFLFVLWGFVFQAVLPRFWGLWILSYSIGVILFVAYAKWLVQTRLAADAEAVSNSNLPNAAAASNVARLRVSLQLIGLFVTLFGPVLLLLGSHNHIIPDRGFAIGLLSYFVAVILLVALVKLLERKQPTSDAQRAMSLDDKTRRWLERWILLLKVWIGILAVSLPLGIANGIVQHALLPTSVGVAINLLMMYLAAQGIKRTQKLIRMSTQSSPDIR